MRGIYVLPLKDAEKGRQRRSRIPQRLTVRPGQTPVTGDGWAGWKTVYASPLRSLRPCWTAFLRILRVQRRLKSRYLWRL